MRHFVLKKIMEELKIRVSWILICFGLTWLTSYLFLEELIFLLAKPLLYSDLFFICTRLTEALSTYVITSLISCLYFAFPCMTYQIWCFLIPSCYERQRKEYEKLFYLSGFCLLLFFFATFVWVVPNVWHFFYCSSTTSTNLLTIKLQPKISDYIMLTVRTLFISLMCSQVPVMVICLLELKAISLRTCLNNRRILRVCSLFIAALFTLPDIWCQIVGCLLLYVLIELTIFVALIMLTYRKQLSR